MTTNHTPAPWYADTELATCAVLPAGTDDWRFAVAVCQPPNYHPSGIAAANAESRANAAHIVRCVNAHDELVAALQRCATALALYGQPSAEGAVKQARAALAKVQP